jgi:curved DNA-binding protein CbpA
MGEDDARRRDASVPDPVRRASGMQPRLVDEEVDLPPELRGRIDDLFANLGAIDLYALLGVARSADRREIKRAYHRLTLELHPDRYFRRPIGSYKAKLEAIFTRLTDAHDLLCSPGRRAAYDGALRANRMSLVDDLLEEAAAEMAGEEERSHREEVDVADEGVQIASASRPPPPPSIAATIARLRELHEKRRAAPLPPPDELLYERLRDELARVFLAAQGLASSPSHARREELRVRVAIPLDLATPHGTSRTGTLDLSAGGFGALVDVPLAPGAACAFALHLAPQAVRGPCSVITCTPHVGDAQAYRASFAVGRLAPDDRVRIEMAVLDAALAAFGQG